MKIRMGVVHVIANCRDCSWETCDYRKGRAAAAKHAKMKKHIVEVEVAKAGTYDGTPE